MDLSILLNTVSGIVWGPITLSLLLGAGIYLTFGLKAFPITNVAYGFKSLFKKDGKQDDGDISSAQSLMTALSATVGTGNIAGVATAIFLGGPGAIFWMWITALFGMATKYCEAFLAIYFRERNSKNNIVGGPMYYIKNGLDKKYHFPLQSEVSNKYVDELINSGTLTLPSFDTCMKYHEPMLKAFNMHYHFITNKKIKDCPIT